MFIYPDGITELKRLTIDPQVKSVHSGYTDQTIGIMSSSIHTKVKLKPVFGVFKTQLKFTKFGHWISKSYRSDNAS